MKLSNPTNGALNQSRMVNWSTCVKLVKIPASDRHDVDQELAKYGREHQGPQHAAPVGRRVAVDSTTSIDLTAWLGQSVGSDRRRSLLSRACSWLLSWHGHVRFLVPAGLG